MTGAINLPQGATIHLQHVGYYDIGEGGTAVLILPPGASSVDALLCGKPRLHATITHDLGTDWPDAIGCQLAQAALDDGGFVALSFANRADAEACRLRLETGRP